MYVDNTQVMNRLEELDVLLLDRNGFPVSFSKNFCRFIDDYLPTKERDIEFGQLVKTLFKQFTKNKKLNSNERYRLYYRIIAELLILISKDDEVVTCEEYRLKIIQRLNL